VVVVAVAVRDDKSAQTFFREFRYVHGLGG
jgi:hypothetical protein